MPAVARARLEFVTPEGLEGCLAELDADAAAGRVRIVRERLLGLALPNAEGGPGGDDCAYDSEATAGFRVRGRRRKCQLARLCVALLPAPSLAGRFDLRNAARRASSGIPWGREARRWLTILRWLTMLNPERATP